MDLFGDAGGCSIIDGRTGLTPAKIVAGRLFEAALRSVDPYRAVRNLGAHLLSVAARYDRVMAVGFGKASCRMALGVSDELGVKLRDGIILTGYGLGKGELPGAIRVIEAGHPLPDCNGLRGTEALIEAVRSAGADTLVVILISGGGSAMLVAPSDGITLEEKQRTTDLLLRGGAGIDDLNCVRKHLSRVKGGRLAELVAPARAVSLVLSDVIGDPLDVIASGPTVPDLTTFGDALAVIERFHLTREIPLPVITHLRNGREGSIPETLKNGDPVFDSVEHIIVGSNRQALDAIALAAAASGLTPEIVSAGLSGEAREAGRRLARHGIEAKRQGARRRCLIAGGETTVTVRGGGRGGRNQELALAAALEMAGSEGITLLSAGTDGLDGPTDAAGAVVDGSTVSEASAQGVEAESCLKENDSYTFFSRCGGLVRTGPTGTNVMDLQIVIIDG